MENKLQHWGVLGMKWGVRRYKNPDGTLTKAGRDRELAEQKETRTESFTLPSGTTLYRASVNKSDIGKNKGPVYITTSDIDRKMYKGAWAKKIAENQSENANKKLYEQKLETTTELKIPSRKEVQKIEQLLKKDPKIRQEVGEAWANGYMSTNNRLMSKIKEIDKLYGEGYATEFLKEHKQLSLNISKNYDKTKDSDSSLYQFSVAIGTSDYTKAAVIRELSKKGYNAMTDEYGVGGGMSKDSYVKEGVQPLIVFDSAHIKQISSSKVSGSQERKATKDYMKWYETENKLQHWGIKGMKWGIRRFQKKDGTLTSDGKKRYEIEDSEEYTKKVNLKKKKIREMTNEELQSLNRRMQLEKQYKELASNDISAGKKFVNGLINQAVKEVESYAMKQVSAKVEEMLKTKVVKK